MVKVPQRSRHIASTKKGDFDPREFLATVGEGKQVLFFAKTHTIFAQGDAADAIFYILEGKVRLTVVSNTGKEATLGIVNVGNFVGEGCLTGQPVRMCSASVMPPCKLLCIDKKVMIFALHRDHALSEMFVAYLLTRNRQYQEDLVDQLFNSSEKRLARVLLLLARFGEEGVSQSRIQNISQETLGEMVGTTRSRVNFFMNRFRKLGFIDYDGSGIRIQNSLLNVILND